MADCHEDVSRRLVSTLSVRMGAGQWCAGLVPRLGKLVVMYCQHYHLLSRRLGGSAEGGLVSPVLSRDFRVRVLLAAVPLVGGFAGFALAHISSSVEPSDRDHYIVICTMI